MSTPAAKFDLHRTQVSPFLFIPFPHFLIFSLLFFSQLAESLHAVADTMRNCAQIAESFAKIVKDAEYSPEVADMLNGLSLSLP